MSTRRPVPVENLASCPQADRLSGGRVPSPATVVGMLNRRARQHSQPTGCDLIAAPPPLAGLAERQEGVLTRRQLAAAGFPERRVRAALGSRRWRAFGRTVVVLHNGTLTPRQREWVAVLLPDKPAALAGLSAATAAGLRGFEPDQVHIVVGHDTQVSAPAWVTLHESRRFRAADINPVAVPPRTRAARAVVDAATWSRPSRRACAILCAAVQQRVVTADRLLIELRRAGGIRHARIMREILGDIGGGGHTLAEIDLGPLALQAGLPRPRRQVLRPEPNGRVRYVDAEFDLPDGTILTVEIDGAVHLQPQAWWDDTSRQNEIVIAGRPMLRFPSLTIRLDGAAVIDQLRRMRLAHTP